MPVAERLVEQLVDGIPRRTLLTNGSYGVVGRVGLGVVVRRDLQVRTRLQVDVAELDPSPLQLLAALAPRGHGPDQGFGVQQVGAHPGENAQEWLAHLVTAAITTISSNATSATGITSRRWRGFTPQP